MTGRPKRSAADLAQEAADCIEDNGLAGDELRLYLTAWLCECAKDGDLDVMREELALASKRYDRILGPK